MATPIPENRVALELGEIAAVCGGTVEGDATLRIRGVETDSRRLGAGQLFVALQGERFDGHAFLDAVQAAGAVALVQRGRDVPEGLSCVRVDDTLRALGDLAAHHRRGWSGQLIGVTGSVGKTSAKELIAAGLLAAGRSVLRTHGNLNNLVGLPMTLLQLDDRVDTAVIEMGTSAPGEIARLAEIARPDVGVVTAVALAHAQGLASVEAIAEEKTALLRALGSDGLAVCPAGDPVITPWLSQVKARCLRFGRDAVADVRLVAEAPSAQLRWACTFEVCGREEALELGLLGSAGAHNAAVALAVAEGVLDTEAARRAFGAGLSQLPPVPGRLFPRPSARGFVILDDTYNASPSACVASLETAVALAHARQGSATAVLGDMAELGVHSTAEHEKLGRKAVRLGVAALVTCGPAMAWASDAAIAEVGQGASTYATRVMHVADPRHAAALALRGLGPGDVVLVKGSRSMAMERVVEQLLTLAGSDAEETAS